MKLGGEAVEKFLLHIVNNVSEVSKNVYLIDNEGLMLTNSVVTNGSN
jgi:hypothetical protein